MKDASTDIIVVSNKVFCKDEIAKDLSKKLGRGCNIINVTNLESINIKQRILFSLLEKNDFVAEESDHVVFKQLSNYSEGSPTIVHMLTSLMQKCSDNRASFEEVRQQLDIVDQELRISQESEDVQCSDQVQQTPNPLQNFCMILVKKMLKLSSPAYCMLSCLAIFEHILLPSFYITELDNLIMYDMGKTQTMLYESLVMELKDNRIIRVCPDPLVYHSNFNPKHTDPNDKLFFIPKLICDAVKSEMNYDSKVIAISYAYRALQNTNAMPSSPYIRILYSQLQKFCKEQNILI